MQHLTPATVAVLDSTGSLKGGTATSSPATPVAGTAETDVSSAVAAGVTSSSEAVASVEEWPARGVP